jgi:hypothetical protein
VALESRPLVHPVFSCACDGRPASAVPSATAPANMSDEEPVPDHEQKIRVVDRTKAIGSRPANPAGLERAASQSAKPDSSDRVIVRFADSPRMVLIGHGLILILLKSKLLGGAFSSNSKQGLTSAYTFCFTPERASVRFVLLSQDFPLKGPFVDAMQALDHRRSQQPVVMDFQ